MKHNDNINYSEPEEKGFKFLFVNGKLWPKVRVKRVDYILIFIAVCFYFVVIGFNHITDTPKHSYVFNPVTKIILKLKTLDYIEDEYPDFYKDAAVDINTGMIKFNSGYMVNSFDKDDTASKITVYFDKKFNITKDTANIIKAK